MTTNTGGTATGPISPRQGPTTTSPRPISLEAAPSSIGGINRRTVSTGTSALSGSSSSVTAPSAEEQVTAYATSQMEEGDSSSTTDSDSDSSSSEEPVRASSGVAFNMFKASKRNSGTFSSSSGASRDRSSGGWTEARRPVRDSTGESSPFSEGGNSGPLMGAFRLAVTSESSNTSLSSSSNAVPTSSPSASRKLEDTIFGKNGASSSQNTSNGRLNASTTLIAPSQPTLRRMPITAGIHQNRKGPKHASASDSSSNDTDSDNELESSEDLYATPMTWNEAFQQAIDMPDLNDNMKQERAETIAQIAQDFVSTAIMFGKIIISEVFLDDANKTIKASAGFGGNAGGEKYVFNGILFKFAVDWKGIYSSDEYAMKAAAHELKGLEQFLDFSPGIRVPLMCLIDYLGFRLIALSLLPINNTTLVYGSDNAGHTVVAQDPDGHMKHAGQVLNLKEHVAGQKEGFTETVSFPADIEGHIGTDKRFYVLDLARLMPPTAPSKVQVSAQYLFRLFRPEFVRGYRHPLSPDAYSNFDKCDAGREVHRREIVDATAALLDQIAVRIGNLETGCVFNDRTKPNQFIDMVHKAGANLRYLPVICTRAGPYLRTFVMLEMIARGIKTHLREVLRRAVREQMTMALQPYRAVLVEQFNVMLGNVPERRRESTAFWSQLHTKLMSQFEGFPSVENLRRSLQRDLPGIFLINRVCTSSPQLEVDMPPMVSYECYTCGLLYPQGLCQVCAQTCHAHHSLSKPKWRSSTFCSCAIPTCCRTFEPKLTSGGGDHHPLKTFAEVIGLGRIFERAADLAGISLSKDARAELAANPNQFIFVLPDIKDLYLKSKQLTITTLAEAQSLHLAARNRNNYERTRMFHQTNNLFEKTLKMSPGARSLRVLFLSVLYEQLTLSESVDDRILSKCVHYVQELKDSKVARDVIVSLFNQSPDVLQRISDHLQICFSIVLETGQNLKSNERMEVLEFIAHFGKSLISLDLGLTAYSTILDDEILMKLAEGCQKLQQIKLNYQTRKVSDATLAKAAALWKGLRHIDLSSSSTNDNVLCAFAANCPFIRTLDISSCSQLTSASLRSISKLNDLTVLNMSYMTISEVSALGQLERLELLTMRDCSIIRSQFKSMLQPVGKQASSSLKVLDISLCTFDNPAVISDVFAMCADLHHLYLDGCKVGEEWLLKEPPKMPTLHISLKGWKLHQSTVDTLRSLKIKPDIDNPEAILPGNAILPATPKESGKTTIKSLADYAISRITRQ